MSIVSSSDGLVLGTSSLSNVQLPTSNHIHDEQSVRVDDRRRRPLVGGTGVRPLRFDLEYEQVVQSELELLALDELETVT